MSEALPDSPRERRLYVHKDTLGKLACTSERVASFVSLLLLNTRLARQAEHRVSQLADLGAVRQEFVEAFVGPLVRSRDESFVGLRAVRYRPRLPYLGTDPRSLMGPDEKPYATCSDGADYYYFAKDKDAAFRMWEDDSLIKDLRDRVSRGEEPDLTFISGDNLIPPTPEFDTPEYVAPISLSRARIIEAQIRKDALQYRLPQHADWAARQVGGLEFDESAIVTTLMHEVFPKELQRPSF
jgi:hypothetical protein